MALFISFISSLFQYYYRQVESVALQFGKRMLLMSRSSFLVHLDTLRECLLLLRLSALVLLSPPIELLVGGRIGGKNLAGKSNGRLLAFEFLERRFLI